MPTFNSPIVTGPFLRDARLGTIQMFRNDELQQYICPFKPKKKYVRELIVHYLSAQYRQPAPVVALAQHIEKRDADLHWLLLILYKFQPTHQIFISRGKAAKKPDPEAVRLLVQAPGSLVGVHRPFDSRKGARTCMSILLSKEEIEAHKLAKKEKRMKRSA